MKNTDATLQTSPVTDAAARDNFTKLNRILQGDFVRQSGTFDVKVAHIWTPDQTWTIAFERIGAHVLWQPTFDLISSSKPDTSNPAFHAPLPEILWPRAKQRVSTHYSHNGSEVAGGAIIIGTDGNVTFFPAPGAAWSSGVATTLYANAVSYLGF